MIASKWAATWPTVLLRHDVGVRVSLSKVSGSSGQQGVSAGSRLIERRCPAYSCRAEPEDVLDHENDRLQSVAFARYDLKPFGFGIVAGVVDGSGS